VVAHSFHPIRMSVEESVKKRLSLAFLVNIFIFILYICLFYATLWGKIRSWVGIASAEPLCLLEHFYQFVYSVGGSSIIRSFMQLIWLCCVWVLWNKRNSRVFKDTDHTVHQLVEKVKLHSFWWMKANNISIRHNFHMLWSSPFV